MSRSSLDTYVARIALIGLSGATSAVLGTMIGSWAMGDVDAFYMAPVDQYGTPAYARAQPVADSFWQRQDGSAAPQSTDATSTATSE